MIQALIAAAKVNKYAVREGGDSVEVVERPGGGVSMVMVDGQGSGRAAKSIANMVTSKVVGLIKEGARDGAVARAANDYLYTFRHGQVSATLNFLSVDMSTLSIVVSRNSHCPVIMLTEEGLAVLDETSQPLGVYAKTKPVITEIEAKPGTTILIFTDGILHAGRRTGRTIDTVAIFQQLHEAHNGDADALAQGILGEAIRLDDRRPADDMSVLALTVTDTSEEPAIREMALRIPFV